MGQRGMYDAVDDRVIVGTLWGYGTMGPYEDVELGGGDN